MILYIGLGITVGFVGGYILAALMATNSRSLADENLQAYCETLESELDKAHLENEKLFKELRGHGDE